MPVGRKCGPYCRHAIASGETGGRACAILTLGWLHAIEFNIVAGWRVDGGTAAWNLFGISLLAPITLGVSCGALLRNPADLRWPSPWLTIAFAAASLVPSSTVAAISLVLFAGCMALRSGGTARFAAACIAGLGLCALWLSVGQPVFSPWLLAADASAAQWLLGWFRAGVVRDGNVLTTATGHRVVILLACATSTALPSILLASTALALRHAVRLTRRWAISMGLLAVTCVSLNVVRLAWLSSSPDAYALVHGPLGQNVFDALQVLLVLTAATLGEGRDGPVRLRPGMPGRRSGGSRRFATAYGLALCVLAGLALTGARYSRSEEPLVDETAGAVARLLADEGWHPAGTRELIANTGYAMTEFRHDLCLAPLSVAVLPGSAEAVAAAQVALGNDHAFLHGGKLGRLPPEGLRLDNLSVGALLRRLRLGERDMPLIAIGPAPGPLPGGPCAPPTTAAWEQLRPLITASQPL